MRFDARFAYALAAITGLTGPQATGAISGAVVDSLTSQPVAGAVVMLSSGSARSGGPGTQQLTDNFGRFVFAGLDAGPTYAFRAKKYGYFDSLPEDVSTRNVQLTPGEWVRDLTISMRRPGSITGSVRDEAGEPVVGAFVRLYSDIFVAGVPHAVAGPVSKTDDRGIYRFGALLPGAYTIVVPSVQYAVPAGTSRLALSGLTPESVAAYDARGQAPPYRDEAVVPVDPDNQLVIGAFATPPPAADGRPQAYPITYFPGVRTRDTAARLNIAAGTNLSGMDIRLTPVPTTRVSGRLEGPAAATAGMTLRLVPPDGEGFAAGSEAATALVRPDGGFTFLNVPTGDYLLIATRSQTEYANVGGNSLARVLPDPPGVQFSGMSSSAAMSAPRGTMMSSRRASGDAEFFARVPVAVPDAGLADLVVPMTRGGAISGRVVQEGESPGIAIGLRSIAAEPANGDAALGQILGRIDPERMTFAIEGLRAGGYLLRPFGGRWLIKSVQWQGRELRDAVFDASTGQRYDDVVVTVTEVTASVSGTVRNQQGLVDGEAAVIVFPAAPDGWREYGLQPPDLTSVAVAPDGRFQVRRLPAGDYRVIAVPATQIDAWKDPAFLERAAGQSTRFSVDWGEESQQNLTVQIVRER